MEPTQLPAGLSTDAAKRLADTLALDASGCWLWPSDRRRTIRIGREGRVPVERILYRLAIGPVPIDAVKLRCPDTHACCRPEHLVPITGTSRPKCEVLGCHRMIRAFSVCEFHSDRARKMPEAERFWSRAVPQDGCLVWTGHRDKDGYGLGRWRGKTVRVHRAAWEQAYGPIPGDGDWTIDHLCYNPPCINVAHMEVVTRAENTSRARRRLATRKAAS